MCVAVTLAPGAELTLLEVERMNRSNADGVGVAWARNGVVQWYKTTKVDPAYITRMIASWKAHPRLVHFRYATAGGTRPDLCHPFEVGPKANCHPVGRAAKVMIHNGHWSRWDEVKSLLDKEGLLPPGPWSDSRLAAYLAHTDPDWFEALGGRVAVMSGDGTIVRLGDWQELRRGVMVSNKSWDVDRTYTRGGYSGYRSWKGWNWSDDEWEAFFKEQEEQEQRDLEAIKAEIARERAEAEKEKKGQKHGQAQEAGGGGHHSSSGADLVPSCGERACLTTKGDAGCGDDGVCAWDLARQPELEIPKGTTRASGSLPQASQSRALDERPWKSAIDNKWYQAVRGPNGTATVVEVAAPGSSDSTGA